MADRGFTIKDILNDIGVKLNIPPFMDGCKQLPAEEISEGRKIASVCIHVERAIGRMKSFSILKHTIPITLAGLSNYIRYCSIITSLLHASPLVSPRAVRVESAKSYRGKLRFHVTGRDFSTRRLVAFHDTWHFHETTRGISTKRVVEFPQDQLPWNLAWNIHETSSRGA